MKRERFVFLSDAHLGANIAGAQHRDKVLLNFLCSLVGKVDRVFFLGDMFDFWIEYGQWIRPEYRAFVNTLKYLSQAGIVLDYVPGNHDFSLGHVLFQQTGMKRHPPCAEILLGNRRLLISHGDRLCNRDWLHRFIRLILWNPSCHQCWKIIPREIGIRIALFVSALSRLLHHTNRNRKSKEKMGRIGTALMNCGYDLVILGHSHFPDMMTFNDKQYCNTGQWIHTYTYVILDEGKLYLKEYGNPCKR
jgi:UDP-2,3-diacylglucosamine hydrolase